MDTVKKDKVIKPRNLIKNDVVFKTYKIYNYKYKRTPERVATVNRCYLPHLLVWWDADMLIYHDGVLHIKEHPEVIVFDEGSYNLITFEYLSVFDTLQKYYGYNDNQAIYMGLYFYQKVCKTSIKAYVEAHYPLVLDIPNPDMLNLNSLLDNDLFVDRYSKDSKKTAYAYLESTKLIDDAYVKDLIANRLVTMDNDKNLCFLSYDSNHNVVSAVKEGTHSFFDYTQHLSVKRNMGFEYALSPAREHNYFENVFVFSNPINLLSFLTFCKSGNLDMEIPESSCFITLCGNHIGALRGFLHRHSEVMNVYSCLDNDNEGIRTAEHIKGYCQFFKETRQYRFIDMQPKLKEISTKKGYVKDWNAVLHT